MSRHHQLSAMLPAAAALAAAVVGVILVDRRPVHPAAPAADPRPAPAVAPELPPIAALAHYRGRGDDPWRDLNPFVPWQLRRSELAAGGVEPEPESEPITPPPGDPDAMTPALTGTGTPERDDGGLPPLLTASDDGLQVVGLLRGPGTQLVRVRLGRTTATLRPGQAIEAWRYRGVVDGLARFTAPDGSEQALAMAAQESGSGGRRRPPTDAAAR